MPDPTKIHSVSFSVSQSDKEEQKVPQLNSLLIEKYKTNFAIK